MLWGSLRRDITVQSKAYSQKKCPRVPHPAPGRADYERVFVGVNSDADIISGALFKLSGTLFRVPETSELSGPHFCQCGKI